MGAQVPEIRRGTISDLDVVMSIERAADAEPWARVFFTRDLSDDQSRILLISPASGSAPVSCLSFWISHDEAHIVNLATHPDHRRRGYAARLLQHLLSCVAADGIRFAMLEVRRSSSGAIALYRRVGFRILGARPLYYTDKEDALVMVRRVDLQSDPSVLRVP